MRSRGVRRLVKMKICDDRNWRVRAGLGGGIWILKCSGQVGQASGGVTGSVGPGPLAAGASTLPRKAPLDFLGSRLEILSISRVPHDNVL